MKILCVIVLYKTSLFDSNSFIECANHAIQDHDFKLYVYDNSPVPLHSVEELRQLNIEYVADMSNSGVSRAYNMAAKYARNSGYEWLLLLDQDTTFQDNGYIKVCKRIIENFQYVLYVPLVKKVNGNYFSPQWMKRHIPMSAITVTDRAYPLKNVSVINSGLLIKVDVFLQAGGYNENVPLDLADYQFIERLSKNIDTFYLMKYVLYQSFSNDVDCINTLEFRFKSYCVSSLHYDADFISKCDILFTMIKRCASLIYRTKRLYFLWIMLKTIVRLIFPSKTTRVKRSIDSSDSIV